MIVPLLAGFAGIQSDRGVGTRGGAARIEQDQWTAAVTATPFLQMLMAAYDPVEHDASSLRARVCAG